MNIFSIPLIFFAFLELLALFAALNSHGHANSTIGFVCELIFVIVTMPIQPIGWSIEQHISTWPILSQNYWPHILAEQFIIFTITFVLVFLSWIIKKASIDNNEPPNP